MKQKIKNTINRIITSYFSERFPEDIEKRVRRWLIQKDENESLKEEAMERVMWDESLCRKHKVEKEELREALNNTRLKMGLPVSNFVPDKKRFQFRRASMQIAAVLVPFIVITTVFVFYHYNKDVSVPDIEKVWVSASDNVQRKITLSDGSVVWLSPKASIGYSKQFGTDRTLILKGEAFFKVASNPQYPFVVHAGKLKVEVVGTQFNIINRENEEQEVLVDKGTVKVDVDNKQLLMNMNERLRYDEKSGVEVDVVDDKDAWWNKPLSFHSMPINEIFDQMELLLGIEIIGYEGINNTQKFSFDFNRDDSIDVMMSIISDLSGMFEYEINKNQIIIKL